MVKDQVTYSQQSIQSARLGAMDNETKTLLIRDLDNLLHSYCPDLYTATETINQLTSELDKFKDLNETNKDTIQRISNENTSLIKENSRLRRELASLKDCQPHENTNHFSYQYDILNFNEGTSVSDIEYLADTLLSLTNDLYDKGDYLITDIQDVATIFNILTEGYSRINKKYLFQGNKTDFVAFWNNNIVSRISDVLRATKLTISNTGSFRSQCNKKMYAGGPSSWRSLYSNSSSKNTSLHRAININVRLVESLK